MPALCAQGHPGSQNPLEVLESGGGVGGCVPVTEHRQTAPAASLWELGVVPETMAHCELVGPYTRFPPPWQLLTEWFGTIWFCYSSLILFLFKI